MKTSIVPAQITTVEDKVAGSLSLPQLLLLATPVFIGGAIYVLMPPFTAGSQIKISIITIVTAIFWLSAIRVKGKIAIQWLILFLQYSLRPRYYIYEKNDKYLRPFPAPVKLDKTNQKPISEKTSIVLQDDFSVSTADRVLLEEVMSNPDANLHFKVTKGGLHARITEVE